DGAGKLLQREVDQRAVCPWAAMRGVKMIAASLRLEAGRAVRGDAVAECAVHALKIAGLPGLRGGVFVGVPLSVNQHTHQAASPRTSAAAWRIAAIFLRYDSGVRS